MESNIHIERIANAIMMDKTFKGHFLIVEGPKDFKAYNKFFNAQNIRIKEAFGCEKVKGVLDTLSQRGFTKKIGIIDADFGNILGTKSTLPDLFHTDFHDIEVMICNSTALMNVVNLYCSSARIDAFEKKINSTIDQAILLMSKEIALLKLANKMHNLGLIFKPKEIDGNQIKYRDFIDSTTFEFQGREKLVDTLINYTRSKNPQVSDKKEIMDKLNDVAKHTYNIHQLVNGHDLSNVLFILIKKVLGSTNKMVQDFNSVEDSLILAYEFDEFKKTSLYNDLKAYEVQNSLSILK